MMDILLFLPEISSLIWTLTGNLDARKTLVLTLQDSNPLSRSTLFILSIPECCVVLLGRKKGNCKRRCCERYRDKRGSSGDV